ncbi:Gamma-glutamyltranspeptidase 1 [Bulinus truncatus]|nr:Gamma-glutamyltranspeptidase 1 [Bulinus truncatus]
MPSSASNDIRYEYQTLADNEDEVHTNHRRVARSSGLVFAGILSFVLTAGLFLAVVLAIRRNGSGSFKTVGYRSAAVAADTQLCSTVGKDILIKGGNAVDAAIAALICSGLGSPQSMGIGGGFFMIIYNKTTGQSTVIDARETAPSSATADMFVKNASSSATGPLSIAVPGEIKGYWYAHQKYGRLPWSDLFQPSIQYAEKGFPVPIGLHKALIDGESFILNEPLLKSIFWNEKTGALFKKDETIKMPELAQTLKAIAEGGEAAFYNGTLTDLIMQDLKDIGSIIIRKDLLDYKVKEKQPTNVTLSGGIRLITSPAPSSGPVLTLILNILDGFNFTQGDIDTVEARTKTYHRFIETFKFGYSKRTGLGDDEFVDIEKLVHNLTSRDYADSIRSLINDSRTYDYVYYGPTYYSQVKTSTSHLTVMDSQGTAVSVTSTINARFGSHCRGLRTGIIFNDEMDDFSTPNITNEWGIYPSPANFIAPGKRPISSMCPSILVDRNGSVYKILGAAGGSMITSATAWVAAHLLWLGENIDRAVNEPRLHHQLLPSSVQYETGFEAAIVQALAKIGHNVTEFLPGQSIVQGIEVMNNFIQAKSDDRKGGQPDGY